MPNNPVMTAGQGFFIQGMDRTAPQMQDSTREAGLTADILMGAPLAMLGTAIGTGDEAGKLHTLPSAANDGFYGVSSSNINNLLGRTSLGEFQALRANAELTGRFIIRQSVLLNSGFAQITINPFVTFPVFGTDEGKLVHACALSQAGTDIVDLALTGSASKIVLKWLIDGSTAAGAIGFENVAKIVNISSDSSEVELALFGSQALYATFDNS